IRSSAPPIGSFPASQPMRATPKPTARPRRWSWAAPILQPLPDRQFAYRRPAAQAGGVAHHRGRPSRRGLSGAAAAEPMPTKAPTKTIENGWRLRWGLGLFRTENTDDIISIASAVVPNFGYFQ